MTVKIMEIRCDCACGCRVTEVLECRLVLAVKGKLEGRGWSLSWTADVCPECESRNCRFSMLRLPVLDVGVFACPV